MSTRPAQVAAAVTVAFWCGLVAWMPLTSDAGALLAAGFVVALLSLVGVLTRRAGLGQGAVALLQLATVAGSLLGGAVLAEGPDAPGRVPDLLASTLPQLWSQAAPLRPDLGMALGIVLVVGLLAVVADALAVGRDTPGWAAVPLLTLYLVPAVGLTRDVPPGHFALLAAGMGLVLYAAGEHHQAPGRRGLATRGVALATAGALVGVAVGLTLATPVTVTRPRGQQPIQMSDPSLDLKRNLTQGSSEPIIWYTTDRPTGTYLRLVSLPLFDETGFRLTDVRVSSGGLPAPPGLTRDVEERTTRLEIGEFISEWLPLPWAPLRVDVGEDWGHVADGLDMLALGFEGRTQATRGISYEVVSVDVRPRDAEIATAAAGVAADLELTTAVPPGLDPAVAELTAEVVRGAATDGERALRLESFLTSGTFAYSTRPAPGSSLATLEDFLLRSRTGYCEQFAGAMATMARQAGIPSRIAVGFTPGRRGDDGRWEVSSRDMHAWPELYLDGWGWVAFEPTPPSGVPSVADGETEPEPVEPTLEPTAEPSVEPTAEPTDPDAEAAEGAGRWRAVLGVVLLAAVAAAVAATPRALRALRRRRRFAEGLDARAAAVGAWAEARDAFADLGLAWPQGSPRHVVAALGELGDPLGALAHQAELALYADPAGPLRAASESAGWAGAVAAAVSAAGRTVSGRDRFLAVWWPRSLWGPVWTSLRGRLGRWWGFRGTR